MLQQIKNIAVAVGGLAATKKILGLSDTLASTKARLNLIVDDGGSVNELEKKIMASAQRSRAVSYTHLDVYKRQAVIIDDGPITLKRISFYGDSLDCYLEGGSSRVAPIFISHAEYLSLIHI